MAVAASKPMRRVPIAPRTNLEARATELGFTFHARDGEIYWDESAYYEFSLEEIERDLEAPSHELAALCLELAGRICNDETLLRKLAIPAHAWDLIATSWKVREPSLYGRFDLAYGGDGPAKLLEYNADTPTSLFEASVFQWLWLEDSIVSGSLDKNADQFNSLHEKLIERLRSIVKSSPLHLTAVLDNEEDRGFIAYLEDCAKQAGLATSRLGIADIGVDTRQDFVDLFGTKIDCLFKLYPWEWMFADPFGASPAMRHTRFIEPPWKAVLSNKGILPLLWEMAPSHPNLLPAFFEGDPRKEELGAHFARKPIYSREGENVLIVDGDRVVAREEGTYGAEGFVRQAIAPMRCFDGNYPVIGSWIVGDEACGIGIREDKTMITRNASRFVPHAIIEL
jgi:glutathionylspermidine synthase